MSKLLDAHLRLLNGLIQKRKGEFPQGFKLATFNLETVGLQAALPLLDEIRESKTLNAKLKAELMDQVASLYTIISGLVMDLRLALEEEPRNQFLIRTINALVEFEAGSGKMLPLMLMRLLHLQKSRKLKENIKEKIAAVLALFAATEEAKPLDILLQRLNFQSESFYFREKALPARKPKVAENRENFFKNISTFTKDVRPLELLVVLHNAIHFNREGFSKKFRNLLTVEFKQLAQMIYPSNCEKKLSALILASKQNVRDQQFYFAREYDSIVRQTWKISEDDGDDNEQLLPSSTAAKLNPDVIWEDHEAFDFKALPLGLRAYYSAKQLATRVVNFIRGLFSGSEIKSDDLGFEKTEKSAITPQNVDIMHLHAYQNYIGASEHHHPQACVEAADNCFEGYGLVKQDFKQALSYYQKVENLSQMEHALYRIGTIFHENSHLIPDDHKQAPELLVASYWLRCVNSPDFGSTTGDIANRRSMIKAAGKLAELAVMHPSVAAQIRQDHQPTLLRLIQVTDKDNPALASLLNAWRMEDNKLSPLHIAGAYLACKTAVDLRSDQGDLEEQCSRIAETELQKLFQAHPKLQEQLPNYQPPSKTVNAPESRSGSSSDDEMADPDVVRLKRVNHFSPLKISAMK